MSCTKIVSYAMLINGRPRKIFKPTRGIRQWDPISPYLFLLCVEAFSALLSKAKSEGKIKAIKEAWGYQPLSHLFFVDDSILFCRVSITEWQCIQSILEVNCEGSRQSINKQKTFILFSPNTSNKTKNQVKDVAGVKICHNPGTYLGLGKSKNKNLIP